MRSRNNACLLFFFPALLAGSSPWPEILSSIGIPPSDRQVTVAGPGTPADTSWRKKVESGAYLILEGDSPLAASLGFRPDGQLIDVRSMIDTRRPKLPLILEKPLAMRPFALPAGATIFTKDRWSAAATVAGMKVGQGGVLWVVASPGSHGYERFPYLPQALEDLGWRPSIRADRTWAFFDYSYRTRVDIDYFAAKWRKAGISALHVAAWHFYDPTSERDAYLQQLIEACHRVGILVYAWLELPHVSEKFWNDHPHWREKTAVLQDAALDWRRLMNLANPDCARTVKAGISTLLQRFDWDGVNLAELYYESLEGVGNPSRFTPMNDDVRTRFRIENGFDPADLWTSRKDERSLRLFLDFRISLARRLQEEWLGEMEKVRARRSDFDIVLTHVDDRLDRGMPDAIGADSARAFTLLDQHAFTFLVEDPATLWNLGPRRYPEIAKRYPASQHLGIDINVVDRYQDVYPTKQQTGIELFELVHLAAQSFPRVALYFENSILSPDLELLSAASAVATRFDRTVDQLVVDSPRGLITPWKGPAIVDGHAWPATNGREIILPAGPHNVQRGSTGLLAHLVGFNGDLISATGSGKEIAISYSSSARAMATLDCDVESVALEGKPAQFKRFGQTVVLPSGSHRASLVCP